MNGVIINPGSGPVSGNARDAARNIEAFCADLGLADPVPRAKRLARESDGRFGFRIARGIRRTEVSMPGLPLASDWRVAHHARHRDRALGRAQDRRRSR